MAGVGKRTVAATLVALVSLIGSGCGDVDDVDDGLETLGAAHVAVRGEVLDTPGPVPGNDQMQDIRLGDIEVLWHQEGKYRSSTRSRP